MLTASSRPETTAPVAGAPQPSAPAIGEERLLGELARERELVSATTICGEIDAWFREEPTRRSFVVCGTGGPLLVNRSAFYEALAGRLGFGWALFHDGPLSRLLDRVAPGFELPATMTLREAGLALLERGEVDSDQDVLVRFADRRVGTLPVAIVLAELVEVHARQMQRLETSERRFAALVRSSFDALVVLDGAGRITYASPSAERMSGAAAGTLVGTELLELTHPDERNGLRRLLVECLLVEDADRGGQYRLRKAGEEFGWFQLRVRNLSSDPAVNGVVVNYRDVTEARELEARLRFNAFHDHLTGLANRASIVEQGGRLLARAEEQGWQAAALFVDLDAFKDVNDTLGHSAGDQLLREVATRVQQILRPGELFGRLGGDEFVILLDGDPAGRLPDEVAAEVLAALRAPFDLCGKQRSVSGSIGVAAGGHSVEELLQQADIALYEAKGGGRRRIAVFEPSMHRRIEQRLSLEEDLERAITGNELFLLYQPTFDVRTGRATAVEALLRWRHPLHGVVTPDIFIPVLESTGLILRAGRFVLAEACAQLQSWRRDGKEVSMSVNVSARQLETDDLIGDLTDALAASGADPRRLVLEITESTLVQDLDVIAERLATVRKLGIRLAIDDFGTGYSSLAYLRTFALDVLKIDKSFVDALREGPSARAIVRTMLRLGRDLGMVTVAEGVEEDEQLDLLRTEGCDRVQGFLLGRPMPADEVARVLTGRDSAPESAAAR